MVLCGVDWDLGWMFIASFRWSFDLPSAARRVRARDDRGALLRAVHHREHSRGQISAFGLFAVCAAIRLSLIGQMWFAGCALALCTYKPTLLPIILRCSSFGEQWRTLADLRSARAR